MAGPIAISIVGDEKDLVRSLGRSTSALDRVGNAAKTAGKVVGVGLLAAAGAAVKFGVDSVKSLARIERINTQTATVIESTGGAANVTAAQVEKLAGRLEGLTATEAESIQEGANFLLTFKNIRNEVGRGNDIFDQTTAAMVDLSRATGTDMRSASLQLGKALNDPVKGMSALSRVGITFDKQQTKQITKFAEAGDTMAAQKIILAELSSQFGKSGEEFAKTAEGKIELAKHALGTFGETIFEGVLPHVADLATKGTEAFEKLTGYAPQIKDTAGDLVSLGKDVSDVVLPPLKTLGGIVVDLVGFLADLPDPIQSIGVQAAAAALILPKLSGALTTAGTAATQLGRKLTVAETRTRLLGGAARNAAGVAGLVALTAGVDKSDKALSTLTSTAGGAAIGFSVGGPWGAAIGGAAGLVYGLTRKTEQGATAMDRHAEAVAADKAALDKILGTLDQVTGARTRATRAAVANRLEEEGLLEIGSKLGVSSGLLVKASLGHAGAQKVLNRELTNSGSVLNGLQYAKLSRWAEENATAIDAEGKTIRRRTQAVKDSKKPLDELIRDAKRAGVEVDEIGKGKGTQLRRTLRRMESDLGLFPPSTKRTVTKTNRELDKTGDTRPRIKVWENALTAGLGRGDRDARTGKDRVNANLGKAGDTRADLSGFLSSLRAGIDTAKTAASTGGETIGDNLGAGMKEGLGGWGSVVSGMAAGIVDSAIRAARNAAQSKSPSRKTMRLGSDMGEGLAIGIEDKTARTVEAARRQVRETLDAAAAEQRRRPRPVFTTAATAALGGRLTGGPAGGGAVTLTLTAEQLHSLERGRGLTVDLNAWHKAGGR